MLEIHLLGQYELTHDGKPVSIPSRPARTLLAYLVLNRGTHYPREKIAGLLWPDSSENNARKNLRQALWQLQKSIGQSYILADPVSLAFDREADCWLDVEVLEKAPSGDLLEEVTVYEGELLPGFYEDWVLLERDRLNAVFERKIQHLLRDLLKEQRWEEAIEQAESWIARGQIPESAYRTLMKAHAALGERSKVEVVYNRCIEALKQEIGVEPSIETIQLYSGLLADEGSIQPVEKLGLEATPKPDKANLPAQTTRFIGRTSELNEIHRLLNSTRLLTLIGPGGIGKTRLAIEAASDMVDQLEHGCHFVSLAPITEVKYLVQTIAETLKFPLATHKDPQTQLLGYLQNKKLLLVMDNFEHLLEGAEIVNEIIRSTDEVMILATSRERLNLQCETILLIDGMGSPGQLGLEATKNDDAISLFIQSAGKVRPGFDPSSEELKQIARICEIVGGMPLAIELGAAWLHMLTLEDIYFEIEKGLDILITEWRDTPERHRSMRAVFDQSWSLLEPNEQDTLSRLSIFRGGFSRSAAQQVAVASLQSISTFVNKSLLNHDPILDRFQMHELLRQYAHDRLRENRQALQSAREAHAAYYAAFMKQKGEELRGIEQKQALDEIETDIENVRASWRHYLRGRNASQLWKLIIGLWHLHWIRWWNLAGMELFADAVQELDGVDSEESVSIRALSMACQAYFMTWLGLADQGYELAKESVEILSKMDYPEALALAYDSLIVNAYFLGRIIEEAEASRRMYELATELEDKWLVAFSLFGLSMVALIEGDYCQANRLAEQNLALYEEIGERSGSTMPLIVMGHVALACEEFDLAKKHYLRCLEISEQVGFHYSIQTSTKYLAKVALSQEDLAEAEKYLQQSLSLTNEIGFLRDVLNLLYEYARLKMAQGDFIGAAELLELIVQNPASDQTRLFEGSIRDSAMDLLKALKAKLPEDEFRFALDRAQQMDLDEVVAALIEAAPSKSSS